MDNDIDKLVNPDELYIEICKYCLVAKTILDAETQSVNTGEPIDIERFKNMQEVIQFIDKDPLGYVKTIPLHVETLIMAMSQMIAKNNERILAFFDR